MKNNPFSLFDFFNYLFPGAFAFLCIVIFNQYDPYMSFDKNFENFEKIITPLNKALWSYIIVIVLISYPFGHLISYLSSLMVEKFLINLYGYPSDFLLGYKTNKKKKSKSVMIWSVIWRIYKINKKKKIKSVMIWSMIWSVICSVFWRGIIYLILPPLSISSFIAWVTKFDGFILKQLDPKLIENIKIKCKDLESFLNIKKPTRKDFFEILSHYEYEKHERHSVKLDNYVSLYGFLRGITLIFNFLFWGYLLVLIINWSSIMKMNLIYICIFLFFLTYLSFLGFVKFYRRYAYWVYKTLLIDTSMYQNRPK